MLCGLLFKHGMNSRKQSSYWRLSMSGTFSIYKILNLSKSSTMMFISSVPNWSFAKSNLLMQRKLRRHCLPCFLHTWSFSNNTVKEVSLFILSWLRHYFRQKGIMSSYFGTPTYFPWALSLCQKYMLILRISSKGMLLTLAILETSKGRTSARDRDNVSLVVLTRERMLLSQTIRSLTSLALVTSVAAIATRLRNVEPLSTWWNCTWIPWDEDASIKDVPIKVDNLKHTSTPNLMSTFFHPDIIMQDAPGCSYTAPMGTSNTKALPPPDGNTADEENMIVEFASGDIFGDFN